MKQTIVNRAVTILIAWNIILAGCLVVMGRTEVIKGDLNATYYSWTGKHVGSQTTHYVIKVGNGHWLLKSEFTANWFCLVGGDGTNTYSVLVDPKAPQNSPRPASVFPGNFPRAAFDRVTVPWLAYCSSRFLDNAEAARSIPSLWLQPQLYPMAHVCATKVIRLAKLPYLPKEITWVTNSKQIASAASNAWLRIEGANRRQLDRQSVDYNNIVRPGVVLGHYRVLAVTNWGGIEVPMQFQLHAYGYFSKAEVKHAQEILDKIDTANGLANGRKVTDRYLVAVYNGNLTGLSRSKMEVGLPKQSRSMSVTDYRLSDRSKGIGYISYDSRHWKPSVNSFLSNLLKEKKRNPPHNLAQSVPIGRNGRNAVRIAVILIFLAPVLVWGVRKMKGVSKSNNRKGKI